MSDRFDPPVDFAANAHLQSFQQYQQMYDASIADPEKFWAEIAESFTWFEKWNKVCNTTFDEPVDINWFVGGKTNITVNALDRHLETRGDQIALHWQANEPDEALALTYREVHKRVCQAGNALKQLGVEKGDRVCIYMQMIPEAVVAMLACARIGAVHSVVFGAFSEDSLRDRINDSQCTVLITQDTAMRGDKRDIPMKAKADIAVDQCPSIEHVLVVRRTGEAVDMRDGRDVWWHEQVDGQLEECKPEVMDAEDPLFILYTSGSTGKPKGLLHTTAGYMIYTATTFKYVFDYHDGDVWWCTADVGWITGHSYIVYGPMLNGAEQVIFEGIPTYPNPGRFWEVVEKYRVNQFYTAPTAIRALMRHGDSFVTQHDRSSLRLLGTVGEPINPEVWRWYHQVVGDGRCPVVDTWWQTETGGIMITPMPGAHTLKPGSASRPMFGIEPVILDDQGQPVATGEKGKLCIQRSWPGQARTAYGDHERFIGTYFAAYPGQYFTGDGARVDEDGDYWLLGRVDDVINVSGHRLGTAEVESALVQHPAVTEAAVVGCPHPIKGQGIYAYVTLRADQQPDDQLKAELIETVRHEIGPIATPDVIQWAPGLPKTRSGKIMRRILRKIAEGETGQIGDTSTLADPAVVDDLIEHRATLNA